MGRFERPTVQTHRVVGQALSKLAGRLEQEMSQSFGVYLTAMVGFHRYSPCNVLLIAMTKPDATRAAGYRTWQKLGRQGRQVGHLQQPANVGENRYGLDDLRQPVGADPPAQREGVVRRHDGRDATTHRDAWNPTPNGVFDAYDFARATSTAPSPARATEQDGRLAALGIHQLYIRNPRMLWPMPL